MDKKDICTTHVKVHFFACFLELISLFRLYANQYHSATAACSPFKHFSIIGKINGSLAQPFNSDPSFHYAFKKSDGSFLAFCSIPNDVIVVKENEFRW